MRIFLAGAGGVIGVRLVPLLVAAGHEVTGMTRSSGKTGMLRELGAQRFIAQSVAWRPPAGGEAVEEHERLVLDAGGAVLEYGTFYGPGTYGGHGVPDPRGSTSRRRRAARWSSSTRPAACTWSRRVLSARCPGAPSAARRTGCPRRRRPGPSARSAPGRSGRAAARPIPALPRAGPGGASR